MKAVTPSEVKMEVLSPSSVGDVEAEFIRDYLEKRKRQV